MTFQVKVEIQLVLQKQQKKGYVGSDRHEGHETVSKHQDPAECEECSQSRSVPRPHPAAAK